VPDPPLNVCNDLTGIRLVSSPIEVLGGQAQLDDEGARKIFWFDLRPFLAPKPQQSRFVSAHGDPGGRPAYKLAPYIAD
jgi:hypothetical protein